MNVTAEELIRLEVDIDLHGFASRCAKIVPLEI